MTDYFSEIMFVGYAVVERWKSYETGEWIEADNLEDVKFFVSKESAERYVQYCVDAQVRRHNAAVDADNEVIEEQRKRAEYVQSVIPEEIRGEVLVKSVRSPKPHITKDDLDSEWIIREITVEEVFYQWRGKTDVER